MEKQTFVEYVIDIVTHKNYVDLSKDFKKEINLRFEEMYKRYLENEYKKGHSVGYTEGLSKAIETLNTK